MDKLEDFLGKSSKKKRPRSPSPPQKGADPESAPKSQSSGVSAGEQLEEPEVTSEVKPGGKETGSNRKFAVSQPVLKTNPRLPVRSGETNTSKEDSEISLTKYKTSLTQQSGNSRGKSTKKKRRGKASNEIQKDVDRTFQADKYFKREDVKEVLFTVLLRYTERSQLKYVQGMNFIAGFVLHHTLDYELAFNVFMFLQGNPPAA